MTSKGLLAIVACVLGSGVALAQNQPPRLPPASANAALYTKVFPLAVPLVRTVRQRTDGPALNEALARTGMLQLTFCVLLSAGLLLAG